MQRLFLLVTVAMLLTACGQADESTSTPSESNSETAQATATATVTATQPATSTPQPTATATSSPTADPTPTRAESDEPITALDPESLPGIESDLPAYQPSSGTATPVDPNAGPTPTEGPAPELLIDLPPVTEVRSCEHAADLLIERLQMWLDVVAPLSESDLQTGGEIDESIIATLTAIAEQMEAIYITAEGQGCSEQEMNWRLYQGIDQLEASGSFAQSALDQMRASLEEAQRVPPMPEVTPEWQIESCADAADVVIDLVQRMLDSVAGMSVQEFEDLNEPTEAMVNANAEIHVLVEEFRVIGCDDAEVEALVLERIDRLQPDGEAAELMVDEFRIAAEEGRLFEGS